MPLHEAPDVDRRSLIFSLFLRRESRSRHLVKFARTAKFSHKFARRPIFRLGTSIIAAISPLPARRSTAAKFLATDADSDESAFRLTGELQEESILRRGRAALANVTRDFWRHRKDAARGTQHRLGPRPLNPRILF